MWTSWSKPPMIKWKKIWTTPSPQLLACGEQWEQEGEGKISSWCRWHECESIGCNSVICAQHTQELFKAKTNWSILSPSFLGLDSVVHHNSHPLVGIETKYCLVMRYMQYCIAHCLEEPTRCAFWYRGLWTMYLFHMG